VSVLTSHKSVVRMARRVVLGALCAALLVPVVAMTPHQKKPVKLTKTQRTEYRIMQDKKEMGREAVEKKVFDNNTIVLNIDATMSYGAGVTMKQHAELTVEEESYFPRTLHIHKSVSQLDGHTFDHDINVEMFANVAVASSALGGQSNSRRVVVPTGVAIADLGVLAYWYQTLFWYDRDTGGGQRFQFLDPISVTVSSGEMKLDGETTIPVLGKKTRVSVFKLERERLGPATLWVDKNGTIVRGEQNLFVFELVKKKDS
jgi:hypothetical protein